jgi:hypothetical protein
MGNNRVVVYIVFCPTTMHMLNALSEIILLMQLSVRLHVAMSSDALGGKITCASGLIFTGSMSFYGFLGGWSSTGIISCILWATLVLID